MPCRSICWIPALLGAWFPVATAVLKPSHPPRSHLRVTRRGCPLPGVGLAAAAAGGLLHASSCSWSCWAMPSEHLAADMRASWQMALARRRRSWGLLLLLMQKRSCRWTRYGRRSRVTGTRSGTGSGPMQPSNSTDWSVFAAGLDVLVSGCFHDMGASAYHHQRLAEPTQQLALCIWQGPAQWHSGAPQQIAPVPLCLTCCVLHQCALDHVLYPLRYMCVSKGSR